MTANNCKLGANNCKLGANNCKLGAKPGVNSAFLGRQAHNLGVIRPHFGGVLSVIMQIR